ncbi:hypothetical protein C3E79_01665 [Corynebacterium liangguodongii]|uniref:Uncharacterized protein n=2 Tax=Corynebacterium liangguodongii TaxID=2079535 RepID=A0A2S0WCE5_9CORY|nr:hypothetical protein C3E79_01665 [Corynebacterium liangguodongii]PWC00558.1 hypothetical protein DF219_01285 [Corynebacterium liangguodongii]
MVSPHAGIIFALGILYTIFYTRATAERSLKSLPSNIEMNGDMLRLLVFGTAAGLILSTIIYSLLAFSVLRTVAHWGRESGDTTGVFDALFYTISASFIVPLTIRLLPGAEALHAVASAICVLGVTGYFTHKCVSSCYKALIPFVIALLISALLFTAVYRPLFSPLFA